MGICRCRETVETDTGDYKEMRLNIRLDESTESYVYMTLFMGETEVGKLKLKDEDYTEMHKWLDLLETIAELMGKEFKARTTTGYPH